MAVGKPLHLRLFLEGIEVPVISAAVSIQMNAPAACSVQVVPLDEGMNLKPRTMMHLFFLDSKAARNADGSISGGLENAYLLLFCGEVMGFSTVLTPQSRSLVLQGVDFSSYWDSAHAMAIEYGPRGNAVTNHGSLSGGSTGMFDDIVNTQLDRLVSWIGQTPLTDGLKGVSGLAGGIIRMMEAIGGVIPHHKGVNDFFTVAELRARLMSQITAEEGDNTARRVLSGKVFDEWLRHGLQNMGQQVTFRDMMMLLMRYIYYEFVPNPVAMFTPELKKADSKTASRKTKLSDAPSALRIKALIQETLGFVRPAVELKYVGNAEATVINSAIKNLDSVKDLLKGIASSDRQFETVVVGVQNAVLKTRISLQDSRAAALRLRPEVLDSLQSIIDLLNGSEVEVRQGGVTLRGRVQGQRLRSHVFRPDCWFAPAPVCNVVFPEQFSQVTYDRRFSGEVTRLYISTFSTLVGSDALLNSRSTAPQVNFDMKALMKKAGSVSEYQVLLDHELHTGIIPRTECLPDTSAIGTQNLKGGETPSGRRLRWMDRIGLFHFFKYRFGPRQVQVAGRFNPFVVCGFPGVIIRRPFTIAGGDATVLKKRQELFGLQGGSKDALSFVQSHAEELGGPSQFLGLIESVQHSISQEGGGTVMAMSHARTHLGIDDDFVNAFLEQQQGSVKRLVRTTLVYDDLTKKGDAENLKYLVDLTPQGTATSITSKTGKRKTSKVAITSTKKSRNPKEQGAVSVISTFTNVAEGQPETSANPAPPFTAFGSIESIEREDILVPSPHGKRSPGMKGQYGGKIVGVEVHDNGRVVQSALGRSYAAATVYEHVPVSVIEKIPLEQVIKPSWFSSAYEPQNISKKIYQPFFGCDSIMDVLPIGSLGPLPNPDTDPVGTDASPDKSVQEVIQGLIAEETARVSGTVEKAVNLIGYLYGQVRQQGLDVDEFIRQFNNRPIATMAEMLGSNLVFDLQANGQFRPTRQDPQREFVVGFHSAALDERLVLRGALAGLLDSPQFSFSLINGTGKKSAIAPHYDVRKAKRQRVLDYVTAFKNGLSTPDAFRG